MVERIYCMRFENLLIDYNLGVFRDIFFIKIMKNILLRGILKYTKSLG